MNNPAPPAMVMIVGITPPAFGVAGVTAAGWQETSEEQVLSQG